MSNGKDHHPAEAPVAYFAADPANGEFDTFDTLHEAAARADTFLDYADDDAADSGWADEPPQICYGAILGHCVEESREPAPEGSEFKEIVSYRLTVHTPDPEVTALRAEVATLREISERCGASALKCEATIARVRALADEFEYRTPGASSELAKKIRAALDGA